MSWSLTIGRFGTTTVRVHLTFFLLLVWIGVSAWQQGGLTASRYAHPAYADGFALECEALRRVREEMGLTNLRVMVPFCRRVTEAERVLQVMALHGLERGRNGLEIYVMCEIPNNVIQVDAFSAVFDGFSIGSNDLTQLTLGVDRDSRNRSVRFRRARSGHVGNAAAGRCGSKTKWPARRHMRRGPGELPRNRSIPHRPWYRLDQCQSLKHCAHHRRGA